MASKGLEVDGAQPCWVQRWSAATRRGGTSLGALTGGSLVQDAGEATQFQTTHTVVGRNDSALALALASSWAFKKTKL